MPIYPRGARGAAGASATLSSATPQALGVAAAGTSGDASRADHVHALPAIPSLSSATPQPIGTATAGVSTDAARADHVHGPQRGLTVDTIPSAVPWSTRNGEGSYAGTATVNVGGTVDFACVAASGHVLAAAGRAPWLSLRPNTVLMARLASITGAGASDHIALFLTTVLATQPVYSGLHVTGTDSCYVLREGGSTAGAVTVAGMTAGQGWLILVVTGSEVMAFVGVGSGGNPPAESTWTYVGCISRSDAVRAPWPVVGVQLNRAGGSGDVSAQVSGWRYGAWW